jgi:hypothetical protein
MKLNDAIARACASKIRSQSPMQERFFHETLMYFKELRRARSMLKLWSQHQTLSPVIRDWLERETKDFVTTASGEDE